MSQREHPVFDALFRREFDTLIRWRRDVRRFQRTPVPDAVLHECLELADLSPSVGLSQPWRFVELISQDRREMIINSFETCNADALNTYQGSTRELYARLKLEGLREAPVHLAVFADRSSLKGKRLGQLTMPETLEYSAVTAVHTFWLAARARGLGTGWVSILDAATVASACDAPDSWKLVAYLCVGWPDEPCEVPELERAGWERRTRAAHLWRRL